MRRSESVTGSKTLYLGCIFPSLNFQTRNRGPEGGLRRSGSDRCRDRQLIRNLTSSAYIAVYIAVYIFYRSISPCLSHTESEKSASQRLYGPWRRRDERARRRLKLKQGTSGSTKKWRTMRQRNPLTKKRVSFQSVAGLARG